MRRVTLKDISKVAGVSYATVSRALSGSKQIGEDTRKRILKICQDMGYTTDYIARSMVLGSTKTLGLIVTNVNNPFMSEMANYVEQTARAQGFDIMLCNSAHNLDQEQQVFRLLVGRRVDGIIIVPVSQESFLSLEPFVKQVPTIFISENSHGMPVNYVSVDNYSGSVLGTEYLVGLGHKKIVYFGRRHGSGTHYLRARGYIATCEKYGLQPRFVDNPNPMTSIQTGYELARKMFANGRLDYTAIFASSDTNALGIIKAADEAGIKIPQQLSILGFDNISYADLPKIDLTTVEQPKEKMASYAVDILIENIQNSSVALRQKALPARIVIRKSCLKIDNSAEPATDKTME